MPVSCEYCVLSIIGLCFGLIPRPRGPTECVCNWEWSGATVTLRTWNETFDCCTGQRVKNCVKWGNGVVKVIWKTKICRTETELQTILTSWKYIRNYSVPRYALNISKIMLIREGDSEAKHTNWTPRQRQIDCPSRRNWKIWVHIHIPRMSLTFYIWPNCTIKKTYNE